MILSVQCNLHTFKCANLGEISAETTNVLDEYMKTILENVRLNYLLERVDSGWDGNLNWEDILSLGEQQRLGMVHNNPSSFV